MLKMLLWSSVTSGDRLEIGLVLNHSLYLRKVALLDFEGNNNNSLFALFVDWFFISSEQSTSMNTWHSNTSSFHRIFSRHTQFLVSFEQIIFISILMHLWWVLHVEWGWNLVDNRLLQSTPVKSVNFIQQFPYRSSKCSWHRHIPESQNEAYGHPPIHILFLKEPKLSKQIATIFNNKTFLYI